MKTFNIIILFCIIFCTACRSKFNTIISDYTLKSQEIKLGFTTKQVIDILEPTQKELSVLERKSKEAFTKNGKHVEIYFYRSGWQNDGILTDDEFTPYIFEDGVLVAIGWTNLGGPKTQGQSRPEINVNHFDYHWRYHRCH